MAFALCRLKLPEHVRSDSRDIMRQIRNTQFTDWARANIAFTTKYSISQILFKDTYILLFTVRKKQKAPIGFYLRETHGKCSNVTVHI